MGLHVVPSNYHQPDVEKVENKYDAARRYGVGLIVGSGWTAGSSPFAGAGGSCARNDWTVGSGTSANPFVFDDDDDETPSNPQSSRCMAYPNTSAHPPISNNVCCLAAGST